jgi:hypothetical protein
LVRDIVEAYERKAKTEAEAKEVQAGESRGEE